MSDIPLNNRGTATLSAAEPSSPTADEESRGGKALNSRNNSITSSALTAARLLQPTSAPASAPSERGVECDNDNVKVCCRVRPFNEREMSLHAKEQEKLTPRSRYPMRSVIDMNGRDTIFLDAAADFAERERFAFDESIWSITDDQQTSANPYSSQADVFGILGEPVLGHAWKGFNSCVFAYGQTGSGKTYTMMGSDEDPGLIPRICTRLFEQVNERKAELARNPSPLQEISLSVEVRFMEIYIEKVHDLLAEYSEVEGKPRSNNPNEGLRVRHHPTQGPFVEGLSAFTVTSWEDCKRLINLGNAERITAETKMNERSSRSHAVFKLTFIQTTKSIPTNKFDRPTVNERYSHISLVDLAGSERNKKSEAVGIHLTEAANINKSLSTLKKVIDALVEMSENKSKKKRQSITIPFRESTLTWLLSDNLGGNSKTMMLCTVSPHADNAEETLLTLRYGLRARGIVCNVRVNEDTQAKQILELQNKLKELQGQVEASAADDTKDLLLDEIEVGRRAIETMQRKILEEEEKSRGLNEAIQKERLARYQGAYYQNFRFLVAQKQGREKQQQLNESVHAMKENLAAALHQIEELEEEKQALEHKVRTMGSDNDSLTLQLDQAKVKIAELRKDNEALGSHIRDTRDKDQALSKFREMLQKEEERRSKEVSELQTRVCLAKMIGAFQLRRQRRQFENLVLKERATVTTERATQQREHQKQVDSLTTLMAETDMQHTEEMEQLERQHQKDIAALQTRIADQQKKVADLEAQLAAKEAEDMRQRKKWEEKCKQVADDWFSRHENAETQHKAELGRLRASYEQALEEQEKGLRVNAESRLEEERRNLLSRIDDLSSQLNQERLAWQAEREALVEGHDKTTKSQSQYIEELREFVKEYCKSDAEFKRLHAKITAVLSNSKKEAESMTKEELLKMLRSYSSQYERSVPVPISLARFSMPSGNGEFACGKAPVVGVETPPVLSPSSLSNNNNHANANQNNNSSFAASARTSLSPVRNTVALPATARLAAAVKTHATRYHPAHKAKRPSA